MPRCLRPWLRFAGMAALAAYLTGCSLDLVRPPARTRLHAIGTSPVGMVSEYLVAWQRRDPERVGNTLDSAYVGTSTDATPGSFSVASFTRATEIDAVRHMSRDTTITQISVQIPYSALRRVAGTGSSPGWATVQVAGGRVVVWRSSVTSWIGRWDTMEFQLKPRIPFREFPDDTLWTIVRWTEARSTT